MTRMALACFLAAWWWALGIVLGAFVNAWMHVLSGGAWGAPVRATALALAGRLPLLLLGLVVIALGMHGLYPWAMLARAEWTHGISRPAFLLAWLTPEFFVARLVIYAIVWWWITRAASLATKGRAALSLVLYAISTSLASVDLLMSLMPGWYSSAFGLVAMSVQALAGAAAVALRVRVTPPISRDLGNLLLMWCMTWGYLAFMQFLIIWAEDIPREIAWYVPRLQTGWQWIATALVFAQLALPFLALLFRRNKDDPARLARIAWWLLAATALDAAWLVLPSVDAHNLQGWWMQPIAFAVAALLVFAPARRLRSLRHA
jgi:hypothetical protein